MESEKYENESFAINFAIQLTPPLLSHSLKVREEYMTNNKL